MTENELKHYVTQAAELHGWAVYHVPQRRILNGGGRGYPDLTLARDGSHLWLELKQENMGQSPYQKDWQREIGPQYHVVRPSDIASGRVAELLA